MFEFCPHPPTPVNHSSWGSNISSSPIFTPNPTSTTLSVHSPTEEQENLEEYLPPIYGFLARVYIHKSQFSQAQSSAQLAFSLAEKYKQSLNNYLLLLAESSYHLGEISNAIAYLKKAQKIGVENDPKLYIKILDRLREIYFEQKEYLLAYNIKQDKQAIEYQYRFKAFIGTSRIQAKSNIQKGDTLENIAPEIVASGREKDVQEIITKVQRNDYKVIVIYGYSGVGKSSLVNAGLIPMLAQNDINSNAIVPVSIRTYTNWIEELGNQLTIALSKKNIDLTTSLNTQDLILAQLQQSESQNLSIVLIFDQFEEFFFVPNSKSAKNELFEFLGECLKIISLKVIFSLRRDYLHFLVDKPGMESINNDLLSKNVLYKITNFNEHEAENIIKNLTSRSNFTLEDALITQLVKDLAGNYGKVRPIELQVVGAQLQAENIRTLAKYQEFGTKEKLVTSYLDSVILDCGEENQQIAKLFLYFLTDEKGTRPLKTRVELEEDFKTLLTIKSEQLDLVSEILVTSGLVFIVPENPENRYQLVHDYLVSFVREQQEQKIQELMAELKAEKEQRQQLETDIERINQELTLVAAEKERVSQEVQMIEETKQKLELAASKATKRVQITSVAFGILILATVGVSSWFATILNQAKAQQQELQTVTELERNNISIIKNSASQPFETMLLAMRSGRKLQTLVKDGRKLEDYPTVSPILALQNTLHKDYYERNQLVHQGTVLSAVFSPNGDRIVTASLDKTAKIWRVESLDQLLDRGCE